MSYINWMSFIKDDVKLTKVIMPGAHNAGSYGMVSSACCQNGDLYDQASYGVRHYCIRMTTNRRGEIVLSHGISKGATLESALKRFRQALDDFPTEFFILDMREYYPQTFGPIRLTSSANPKKVSELLAKYIEPEKYALHDFKKISDVTMGDIRRSGKRYLIVNYIAAYKYSTDCENILPWDQKIYGMLSENFVKRIPSLFDTNKTDGLYWFQTQQTPNIGTEVGFKSPKKLDDGLRPHFHEITEAIAGNPFYLESANIISGDFMTEDYMKCREIIGLNVPKGNVNSGDEEKFIAELNA